MDHDLKTALLGSLSVAATAVAVGTGHPAAFVVAGASAGAMLGVVRDAMTAPETAAGVGALATQQIAEASGKTVAQLGTTAFVVKVNPLQAEATERALRNAASRIDPSVYVYRQPGQGVEPTRFVVAPEPMAVRGAKLIHGGAALPSKLDPNIPPDVQIPAPAQAQVSFRGAGGWSYYRAQSGDIVVTNDPRPGKPMQGKTVTRGSAAWKAIDAEMRTAGR